MIISILILAAAAFCASAGASPSGMDVADETPLVRHARSWRPPDLIRVAAYWKSFSKLRYRALQWCENRRNIYERRKSATEMFMNVAKRSPLGVNEIEAAQAETAKSELHLQACYDDIIAPQAGDIFYRNYQLLSAEVQRLKDQITSCEVAKLAKLDDNKPRPPRPVGNLGTQRVARSSLEGYEEEKRLKDLYLEEKDRCFQSLGIPKNFPYQLE